MKLRYGMNPNQWVQAAPSVGDRWPVHVVHGVPSYVNLLDALNGWQLVREVSQALHLPTAASFKHVSPAGVAVAGAVDDGMLAICGLNRDHVSPSAGAYLRCRDVDPRSSYGDMVAVSHHVDADLAQVLADVVSDGIIAPAFEPGTVAALSRKKAGSFLILQADETFVPPDIETRDVHGLRLTQSRDTNPLDESALANRRVGASLPQAAIDDLLLGLITLRYTQSNSVCYVRDGITLGIGAGQQSRIDCTRLAGAKVDTWWQRRLPAVRDLVFRRGVRRQERINWQVRCAEGVLTSEEQHDLNQALVSQFEEPGLQQRVAWARQLDLVSFASDGALPFRDNVDEAHRHGVSYIAEPGGSNRTGDVEEACREHGITLVHTGRRLFHH